MGTVNWEARYLEQIEARLDGVDQHLGRLDGRIDALYRVLLATAASAAVAAIASVVSLVIALAGRPA